MYLSNFMETGFLNALRGITFAAPSQLYCGLFISNPTKSGAAGTELNYEGYRRLPIIFNPPTLETTQVVIKNREQLTYAQSPVAAGTVRYIGIYDSITGGNMYLYGSLTEDLQILQGENPVLLLNEVLFFSIGDLSSAYKIRLFNVVRGTSLQGITPHLALFNGNPQSGGAELAGDNYARVPVTFSAPVNESGSMAVIRNTTRNEFARPTSNWGNWTFTAVFDAMAAGEPVFLQQRSSGRMINRGIMPYAEDGDITAGIG
jgi:hypothetical protein